MVTLENVMSEMAIRNSPDAPGVRANGVGQIYHPEKKQRDRNCVPAKRRHRVDEQTYEPTCGTSRRYAKIREAPQTVVQGGA